MKSIRFNAKISWKLNQRVITLIINSSETVHILNLYQNYDQNYENEWMSNTESVRTGFTQTFQNANKLSQNVGFNHKDEQQTIRKVPTLLNDSDPTMLHVSGLAGRLYHKYWKHLRNITYNPLYSAMQTHSMISKMYFPQFYFTKERLSNSWLLSLKKRINTSVHIQGRSQAWAWWGLSLPKQNIAYLPFLAYVFC